MDCLLVIVVIFFENYLFAQAFTSVTEIENQKVCTNFF